MFSPNLVPPLNFHIIFIPLLEIILLILFLVSYCLLFLPYGQYVLHIVHLQIQMPHIQIYNHHNLINLMSMNMHSMLYGMLSDLISTFNCNLVETIAGFYCN